VVLLGLQVIATPLGGLAANDGSGALCRGVDVLAHDSRVTCGDA
jgi:hypothetical protein